MAGESAPSAEDFSGWLTPRDALNLVQLVHPDISVAAILIVERLTGGKIVAAAESSVWGDSGKPSGIAAIPASYWPSLSGNRPDWWDTGDVRFFIRSGRREVPPRTGRFFGVRFKPDGISEITASARRERLSPAEYENWLPPRAALNALKPMSFDAAASMIIDHARAGLVEAVARLVQFSSDETQDRHYQIISKRHWAQVRDDDLSNSHFWDSGSIKEPSESTRFERAHGIENDDDPPEIVTLGVRFDPAGIEALKPRAPSPFSSNSDPGPAPPQLPPSATRDDLVGAAEITWLGEKPKHAGGRPAQPFWEAALLAVARRWHFGDFKPKRQADVQRALSDWLSANGHSAGDTATKERARALWEAFKEEDE